jgi:ppGpp synthetase/RelA/SpoT-type nucleotidyltranferase
VSEITLDTAQFDFDAHRQAAVEQYQRVRLLYESFAGTVREILEQALRAASVKVASIEARAKTLESFEDKAATPAEEDPTRPKYPQPLVEITDLAAARVITFFLSTLQDVDRIIAAQFNVLERLDKPDTVKAGIKEDSGFTGSGRAAEDASDDRGWPGRSAN